MKTKNYFLTVLSIIVITMMMWTNSAKAQTTYQVIFWDNYPNVPNMNVAYCSVDSIKCVPPAGASNIIWGSSGVPQTMHGDTLVLPYGIDDQVTCFYSGGQKSLLLRPTISPISPVFPSLDTVCGIATKTLDASNSNLYGFNSYNWNTGATTQTITVGAGNYSVTITNVCGTANASTTIVEYNANPPFLGLDITTCYGTPVTLNPGSGYSDYLWLPGNSTGSTLSPTTSGTYIVETTNTSDGCVDRDTVQITFLLPTAHTICYVEFDTLSHKNRIVWSTPPANADSIKIYSEVSTNVYGLIGTVPASQSYYVDGTSNPQNASNSYKIAAMDSCGNDAQMSAFHKTITLLSAYDQPSNTYGFSWSAYEGLTVANYNIYGLTASNQSTLIGTVPGNSFFYNYTNPSPLFVKYYVAFLTPTCSSKTDYLVKSNYVASVTSGINEADINSFSIYPNPTTGILHIEGNYKLIELYDLTGKLLQQYENVNNIDLSTYSKSIYFVRIIGDSFVRTEKVVVE